MSEICYYGSPTEGEIGDVQMHDTLTPAPPPITADTPAAPVKDGTGQHGALGWVTMTARKIFGWVKGSPTDRGDKGLGAGPMHSHNARCIQATRGSSA
jgi:hypothetical protein